MILNDIYCIVLFEKDDDMIIDDGHLRYLDEIIDDHLDEKMMC